MARVWNAILVAAATLVLGALAPARAAVVPGSVNASFSPSPDGAAGYAIPLRGPPGTAGMEPKLALAYSSRGGPSAFGYGWALSGLSLLQRGPRNLSEDGKVTGVQLTDQDAIYLNGQKLIEVTPSVAVPGMREFRTRIDSIARIRSYENTAQGPGYFVVETRAGLKMTCGAHPETRVSLRNGATINWLCEEIEDRAGNYIKFYYLFDDLGGGTRGLEYLLDRVEYTGNRAAGLTPYATIKFNYIDVAAYGTRYIQGQRTKQTKQLQSVVSSYKGQVYRAYRPDIQAPAPNDFFARLSGLTEEGGRGTSFRPLSFSYSESQPKWVQRSLLSGIAGLPGIEEVVADLPNGYRYVDAGTTGAPAPTILVSAVSQAKAVRTAFGFDVGAKQWKERKTLEPPVVFAGGAGPADGVAVADLDGDGRDELLSSAGDYGNVDAVYASDGATWTKGEAPPVTIHGRSLRTSGLLRVDVIDAAGTRKRAVIWDFDPPNGLARRGAKTWAGGVWSDLSAYRPPHPLAGDKARATSGAFVIDVDCDGVRELVYHQSLNGGGTREAIYTPSTQGWKLLSDPRFKLPFGSLPADGALRILDMNGDGCADLAVSYEAAGVITSGIYLASTSGWKTDPRQLPAEPFWRAGDDPELGARAEIADLDGDGRPDVFTTEGGSRTAYRGRASDWIIEPTLKPPQDLPASTRDREVELRIVSLDGDARPEWLNLAPRDGRLEPPIYSYSAVLGWRPDRTFDVPVDIAVFDKVDLGVRFFDLNGDGHPDLVWSRKKSDGSVDEAAYIFTPGAAVVWRRDDRYILPASLINEDFKPTGMLTADVSGDGLVDLMLGYRTRTGGVDVDELKTWVNCTGQAACEAAAPTQKSAFWKSAPASLSPPDAFADENGSLGARLADLNGDGLTDLLVSRTVEKQVDEAGKVQPHAGPETHPVYELYSRSWLNVGATRWVETPELAAPAPFVRPLVRDASGGDEEGVGGVTVVDNRVEIFDLNGDRLPDFLFNYVAYESRTNGAGVYVPTPVPVHGARLNTGSGWADAPAYAPPVRLDSDPAAEKRQVQFQDLNGDGQIDFVVADGAQSKSFLNTGTAWSAEEIAYRIPVAAIRDSKGDQGFRFLDLNGDGLPDIAYHWTTDGDPVKGAYLNTGTTWKAATAAAAPPLPMAEHQRGDNGVRPLDLNGDGLLDLVQAFKRSASDSSRLVYANESARPYLLQQVTNGIGHVTTIEYRSFLAFQMPEDKVAGMLAPAAVKLSPGRGPGAYPVIDAPMPGYLVVRTTTSGPGLAPRSSRFQYDGYRVDIRAGQPLGFDRQVVTDEQRGRKVTLHFMQEPGLVGAIAASETEQGGRIIATSASDWVIVTSQGAPISTPSGPFQPLILRSQLSQGASRSWDLNGAPIGGQTDKYQYDAYANVVSVETLFLDGSGALTHNRYADDVAAWKLALLVESQATLTAPLKTPQTRFSKFNYDGSGLLDRETALVGTPYELVTHFRRDRFGNKVGVFRSRPDLTEARSETYEFDGEGRFAIATVNALGHRATTAYDPASGVIVGKTDANGVSLRYEFDDLQRLTAEVAPNGLRTEMIADFAPRGAPWSLSLTRRTTGLPASTSWLDAALRTVHTEQAGWQGRQVISEVGFDTLGRVAWVLAPHFSGTTGPKTTRTYDALDRLLIETRPDGTRSRTTYDGLETVVTNTMGAESRAVSDLRGRLVKTVDPLGGVTTFYYDVAGRIVRTTNALGLENLQRYDDGGQRVSVKDASLGEWTYAFDVYGDVVGQTDPRGKSASLIYDALGRLTARRTADEVTAWTYDTASNGIGRLASSSSGPRRGKRYAYDGYGRLVGVVVTVGKDSVGLKDSHDELGRLVRRTYTTGVSITNAYDTHGFWTSVAMKDGPTARQVYQLVSVDAAGRVTEEVAGDGIRSKHQFDDATGRLLATATRSSAGVAQDLTLTYDVVGNVTARADAATGESDRFEYDALARLTRLTSAKTNIQVSYDALGNITSKSDTGVYKYCDLPGQAAMLCSVQDSAGKSRTLAYDDAGNVTRFGEKLLTYTADGRVASIVADNLGLVRSRFTYDAEGALETQDSRDKTTAFKVAHLGDIEVLRERFTPPHKPTSERTRIRHFIATPTGIAGFYEQNFRHYPYRFASPTYGALQTQKPERVTDLRVGLIFFVKDQVGSLRAIVDVRGKVLDRFSYDPWGKRTDADSDRYKSVRQGFTGHESLDHLDLVHMGGRLYSPELGRFLSPDPLIQAPGFSQSHNRYSYVLNNPLRLIDPSGYGWDPIGDIGNAIGGVVGGIAAGISGVVDAVLGKPMTWLGEQIAKGGRWLSQNWQTVVVIAAAVALGPAGLALNPLLVGAIVGGLDAGLHGGNMQDVLRGAALGAVFSGVSYGMNTGINQAVSSSWGRGALQATGAGLLAQAAGGDFRKGFVTSAVMRLASPGVERLDNSDLRIAVEATAAGVAAELNGDNFEDAALRAAFQRMFTDNIEASRPGSHVVRGPVTAIAGKIWNLPNTAVGIVYGLAGYAYGWAAGYNPSLEFEDGTLHVKNSGLMSSAMTMGNVIVFGPDYGPGVSNEHFATTPSGYTVGQEEYLHTVQGEVLGPLYFPAHIIGGTISLWSDPLPGYSGGDKWHQNNAFETGPMTGNGAFRLDPRRRRRGRRSVGRHPSTRRRNVSRRIKVAA